VTVAEAGGATRHQVTLSQADLERFGADREQPKQVVEAAFRLLRPRAEGGDPRALRRQRGCAELSGIRSGAPALSRKDTLVIRAIAGDIIGSRFERHPAPPAGFDLFHPDCRFRLLRRRGPPPRLVAREGAGPLDAVSRDGRPHRPPSRRSCRGACASASPSRAPSRSTRSFSCSTSRSGRSTRSPAARSRRSFSRSGRRRSRRRDLPGGPDPADDERPLRPYRRKRRDLVVGMSHDVGAVPRPGIYYRIRNHLVQFLARRSKGARRPQGREPTAPPAHDPLRRRRREGSGPEPRAGLFAVHS
jgi:hypothetical protein